MPEIITRAQWGARYRAGFGSRHVGVLDKWLHHSVTQAPDLVPPFDDDYAAVRALESIGQSRFGGGISYTFAVSPAGLIFEGTGVDRIGAHTAGRNTGSAGVVLIGNYETSRPSEQMIDSVAWLLQHGKAAGWWKVAGLNGGHRDVKSTSCPGKFAYGLIGEINRRASGSPVNAPSQGGGSAPSGFLGVRGVHTGLLTADGNFELVIDGSLGGGTISRWQQVMGTPVDGRIDQYPRRSTLIQADQAFLNRAVGTGHIKSLTGKAWLDEDGWDDFTDTHTSRVRQFLLLNWVNPIHQRVLIGKTLDVDGYFGEQSVKILQFALNHARANSGTYGQVG